METVGQTAPKGKKKHNPVMLAVKCAARRLGIPWSEVCYERDRLRETEFEARDYMETARKVAWTFWRVKMGYAPSQDAFWRNGFIRLFSKRIARGCDYTAIRWHDEVAETVRANVPELANDSTAEIFDLLLSPYEPRTACDSWYRIALGNVLVGQSKVNLIAADSLAAPF